MEPLAISIDVDQDELVLSERPPTLRAATPGHVPEELRL